MAGLTQEEMWEAVLNHHPGYEGIFFYGVKSTGVFCRPSCKSKRPVRENVVFFTGLEAALQGGYRPCKRCRPDLPGTVLEPMREIVGRVKQILETDYDRPEILKEAPGRVGVSPIYLQRSFKNLTGTSLKAYLDRIRIQKVQELLVNENLNATVICFAVGFQSLSSFYTLFRAETGLSPGEYATRIRAEKERALRVHAEKERALRVHAEKERALRVHAEKERALRVHGKRRRVGCPGAVEK